MYYLLFALFLFGGCLANPLPLRGELGFGNLVQASVGTPLSGWVPYKKLPVEVEVGFGTLRGPYLAVGALHYFNKSLTGALSNDQYSRLSLGGKLQLTDKVQNGVFDELSLGVSARALYEGGWAVSECNISYQSGVLLGAGCAHGQVGLGIGLEFGYFNPKLEPSSFGETDFKGASFFVQGLLSITLPAGIGIITER
jgi:hypothetical protein